MAGTKVRVLICDCEETWSWPLRQILLFEGHTVEILVGERIDVAEVATYAPDVVLFRCGFDGRQIDLTLLRAIKADRRCAAIPVILLATNRAFANWSLGREGLTVAAVLELPFGAGELLKTLRKIESRVRRMPASGAKQVVWSPELQP